MIIYTIGFTQKTAEVFFESLKDKGISTLIDIRLNNKSQLAGFAKGKDLKYFLKKLCNIEYIYEPKFAPTKELLDDWKKQRITWNEYETVYNQVLIERKAESLFIDRYLREAPDQTDNICLLCSESTPEHCHRRLLAEYLRDNCEEINNLEIIHI